MSTKQNDSLANVDMCGTTGNDTPIESMLLDNSRIFLSRRRFDYKGILAEEIIVEWSTDGLTRKMIWCRYPIEYLMVEEMPNPLCHENYFVNNSSVWNTPIAQQIEEVARKKCQNAFDDLWITGKRKISWGGSVTKKEDNS